MRVKIKQILKMIIEAQKRLLNKIIDEESARVNEFIGSQLCMKING